MHRFTAILVLTLILTADACARMYQWTNPASGTVQMSGSPPAWYRGAQAGPRVLVFDDGELVDDTGIAISEEERIGLREEAFGENAADLEAPEVAVERSADELKAAMSKAHEDGVDIEAVTQEFSDARAAAALAVPAEDDVAAKAEALKSLIDRWDQQQLDQARSLLDLLPDEALPDN